MTFQEITYSVVDYTAQLAAWCAFTLPTIQLLTATLCAGIALLIVLLRREAIPDELWTAFFAMAFLVFFIQYLAQVPGTWAHLWIPQQNIFLNNGLPKITSVLKDICSVANDLLFLACALALLGHKARVKLFPSWALASSFLSLAFLWGSDSLWCRLPHAIFSATCLGFLGWAMYVNFSPERRKSWAVLSLFVALTYGAVNIQYAMNPLVADKIFSSSLRSTLDVHLRNLPIPTGQPSSPLDALDALVFAFAFPLKALLFLAALLLIMKCLTALSPREAERALKEVKKGRVEYLTDQGIVRALGLSVAADLAVLSFRLPGDLQNRLAWWRWLRESNFKPNPEIAEMPNEIRSIVSWVLAEGEEKSCADLESDPEMKERYWACVPGMRAFLSVPIIYQGVAIACLNLEWKNPRSFTATAAQRIRMMADLLAPAVHARRQLNAFDLLNQRIRQIEATSQEIDDSTLGQLLDSLKDVLSPVAIGIQLTMGFRRPVVILGGNGEITTIEKTPSLKEFKRDLARQSGTKMEPVFNKFMLRTEARTFAHLMTVVEHNGNRQQPALVSDYLHRNTIAAMTAVTVLNITRNFLNSNIAQLQTRFNSGDVLNPQQWFETVEESVQKSGILWAAAHLPDGAEPLLLGRASELEIVQRAENWCSIAVENEPVILLIPDQGDSTPRLIRMDLTVSTGVLWVAVGPPDFGIELKLNSPWRRYLGRLVLAADGALVRIEGERKKADADRLSEVATRVEMAALLMHELRNQALEFSAGALGIEDAVRLGDKGKLKTRLIEFRREVSRFAEQASILKGIGRHDNRRRIPLVEAVEKLRRHQEVRLAPLGINLHCDVHHDLYVEITLDTVFLALNSLVTNAATAIGQNGSIRIGAEVSGDNILCYIVDDGPGVPSEILGRLFKIGTSTKKEGGGLGLHLARSALRRQRGDIFFSETQPGRTCFTLQFPKPPGELES